MKKVDFCINQLVSIDMEYHVSCTLEISFETFELRVIGKWQVRRPLRFA